MVDPTAIGVPGYSLAALPVRSARPVIGVGPVAGGAAAGGGAGAGAGFAAGGATGADSGAAMLSKLPGIVSSTSPFTFRFWASESLICPGTNLQPLLPC